jgi:hypothetical protein
MGNIAICTPQPNYVIVEQIYQKRGLPSVPGTGSVIGPSLYQVVRRVLQVCDEQDVFFEGQRLSGMPSTWQYLQELLLPGKQITTRPTGQREFTLAYFGFKNIIQPLPQVGGLLPEAWTRRYNLGTPPSPFIFGHDPIPQIQLYGNPRAEFVMPGGQPPPTAVAIYHASGNRLEFPLVHDRERLIRSLVQPAAAHAEATH